MRDWTDQRLAERVQEIESERSALEDEREAVWAEQSRRRFDALPPEEQQAELKARREMLELYRPYWDFDWRRDFKPGMAITNRLFRPAKDPVSGLKTEPRDA